MRTLWQKEYYLRASDFDRYRYIKPSSVLDLFQDAAGQHAEELGLGFGDMLVRQYLWVLTKIKFEVLSRPKSYQKVIVKTWPLPPSRLCFRREYSIEDETGQMLIKGSSEWVVIHSEKRRFLSVPNLYPFTDGFHEEQMFEGRLPRVADFEATGAPRVVQAGFSEIDLNGHVNNTKYANYVLDAVDPAEGDVLRTFQIDYRKEVMEGTTVSVYHTREGGNVLAKGQNDNGEILFACSLEY